MCKKKSSTKITPYEPEDQHPWVAAALCIWEFGEKKLLNEVPKICHLKEQKGNIFHISPNIRLWLQWLCWSSKYPKGDHNTDPKQKKAKKEEAFASSCGSRWILQQRLNQREKENSWAEEACKGKPNSNVLWDNKWWRISTWTMLIERLHGKSCSTAHQWFFIAYLISLLFPSSNCHNWQSKGSQLEAKE